MKRRFAGLQEIGSTNQIPDGIFLVRVQKAEYRWHAQKPFYTLRLFVLEPKEMAGPHALWPTLLHPKGSLEAGLVLTRLPV